MWYLTNKRCHFSSMSGLQYLKGGVKKRWVDTWKHCPWCTEVLWTRTHSFTLRNQKHHPRHCPNITSRPSDPQPAATVDITPNPTPTLPPTPAPTPPNDPQSATAVDDNPISAKCINNGYIDTVTSDRLIVTFCTCAVCEP